MRKTSPVVSAWLQSIVPQERSEQNPLEARAVQNARSRERFLRVFHPFFWQVHVAVIKPLTQRLEIAWHRHGKTAVARLLLISIVGSMFLPFEKVDAATYTWVQTDWSTGTDSGTYATHASNQTGWAKYAEASSTIAFAAGSLGLGTTYATTTHTSQADFESGTLSTVATSSGSVVLGAGTGINTWSTRASFPSTPLGDIAHTANDYIYSVVGNNTTTFSRYSISGNTWTAMASTPGNIYVGSSLVWTGGDYLYSVAGNGTAFYRYSISGNSWSTMTAVPVEIIRGDSVYPGSGDYIYLVPGDSTTTFYRYSISGNSWTTMATTPAATEGGAQIASDGSNYLYLLRGGDTTSFYRYSISGNSWSAMANFSTNAGVGSAIVYANSSIYATQTGNGACTSCLFYQYSISGNSWTAKANAPGATYHGANMTAPTGVYFYYVLGSNDSQNFRRYQHSNPTYTTSGTFTSPVIDTGLTSSLFDPLDYTATVPANTTLTINVRAGNVATPDGTWTSWSGTIADLGSLSAYNGYRYIQYKANFSTTDTDATPTLSDVAIGYHVLESTLVSSIFDTASASNVLSNLTFSAATTSSATVKFQLRTGNGTATTSWMGSDGTISTYFSTSTGNTIPSALSDGSNDRYVQYRVILGSAVGGSTPTLSDVTLTYVVNAAPDFQTDPTASQATVSTTTPGVVAINYSVRDTDTTSGTVRPGYIVPSFEYSTNGGSSYTSITNPLHLTSGATSTKAVAEGSYTAHALYWWATSTVSNTYVTNARIRITADDGEGASNTVIASTSNFTLDTKSPTSPTISINSGASKSNSTSVTLTLSASDDSSMQMILSESSAFTGASWETYASSKAFTLSSTDAVKTVYAKFRDNYGNESSTASDTITLDTTAPNPPTRPIVQDVSNASSTAYRMFFSWNPASNSDFASYDIHRSTDGSSYSLLVSTTSSSANYYLDTGLTSGTTYYYKVKTVDDISNSSSFTTAVSLSAGGNPSDSGAPTISSVSSGSVTPSSARITWTTDEVSDSTVLYGTTASSLSSSQGVTTYVTSHSVTMVGLSSGTTYYYQVRSIDPSSNSATTTTATFTTLGSDGTAPTVSSISATATTTSATITWTTDETANSYVEYSTTNGFSSGTVFGQDDSVTSHSIILPSVLVPNTTYYYKVRSRDSARNETASSQSSFTTASVPSADTTAPTISSVTSTGVAYNTATVTWTTNETSTSFVEFGQTTEFGRTTGDYTLVSSHSTDLPKDLYPSTTYYYRARSTDISGNEKVSATASFTTSASPSDTTPPTISSISASTTSATGITITWTTNEVADSYIEYASGSTTAYSLSQGKPTMETSHSIVLVGLSPATQYFYRVKSADPSGNTRRDDNSAAGYIFATAASNSNPPVISNIAITEVSTTTAIITWRTDKASDSFVEFGFDTAYGRTAGQFDSVTTHSVSLPRDLISDVTYHFRVRSRDSDNNIAVSSNQSFTTVASAAVSNAEDAVAPVISRVTASYKSTDEAVITWLTDELSTSRVDWGASTAYSQTPVTSATTTIEHAVTLSGLTQSTTYYFRVKSTDAAGNISTDDNSGAGYTLTTEDPVTTGGGTRTVEVSASANAPSISDIKVGSITSGGASITFTTSRDTKAIISYGQSVTLGQLGGNSEKYATDHRIDLSNLKPGTTYNFKIQATDSDSRTRESSLSSFRTLGIDAEAPITTVGDAPHIRALAVSDITMNEALVSFRTSPDTTSFVSYGTTTGLQLKKAGSEQPGTAHEVRLVGLRPGTLYYFNVRVADSETRIRTSNINTFTTPLQRNDVSQPIAFTEASSTPREITFERKIIPVAVLPEQNLTKEEASVADTFLSQTKTTLQAASASLVSRVVNNFFDAISSNPHLASVDETRFTASVTEAASKIVSPPVISSDAISVEAGPRSAVISWKTDKNTNSLVSYAKASEYKAGAVEPYVGTSGHPEEQSTDHQVTLINLDPSVTYHYQIRSEPPLGPATVSEDRTFTTLSLTPEIVDAKFRKITDTSAEIEWQTNLPTKTTIVYTENATGREQTIEQDSFTSAHMTLIENLSPSTSYSVRIKAEDEAGNVSASAILPFSSGISLEPPKISQVRISSALIPDRVTTVQTIISWKTDKPATSRIRFGQGSAGNLTQETPMEQALTFDHVVITTVLKPASVYQIQAESADGQGRIGQSELYTVLAPAPRRSAVDLILQNLDSTFGFINGR